MGSIENVEGARGTTAVYVARPDGDGPFPGVVLHDALGMTCDLRNQAEWLAGSGFLAAAPDLYRWGLKIRCVVSVIADAARGSGPAFDDIEACRQHLIDDLGCTGVIGVIGLYMGGGFAVMLAPGGRYGASVNYGGLPREPESFLKGACPIVASHGAKDRTLSDTGSKLAAVLAANGVAHDVVTYPDAGHSFLNDHNPDEVPWPIGILGRLSNSGFHQPSADHARRRIVAFFRTHLKRRGFGGAIGELLGIGGAMAS